MQDVVLAALLIIMTNCTATRALFGQPSEGQSSTVADHIARIAFVAPSSLLRPRRLSRSSVDATTGRSFAPVRQTLEIRGNSLPPLKEPVTDFSLLFAHFLAKGIRRWLT